MNDNNYGYYYYFITSLIQFISAVYVKIVIHFIITEKE